MTNLIHFRCGFDAHHHARDGLLLEMVIKMLARQFAGAVFEPNLDTPITTGAQALRYKNLIKHEAAKVRPDFTPLVLLYQTDEQDPDNVADSLANGSADGTKFYPRGATTNSHRGIENIRSLWTPGTRPFETLRAVATNRKVAQFHCELNYDLDDNELDPYDKEAYFFREIMPRIMDAHPDLKKSAEHLSTAEGADFLRKYGGPLLGCSVTAHHPSKDRRDMFRGGLRTHLHCLPPIQRLRHQIALIELVTRGFTFVWAGTDSAPHDRRKKECDCCSGGIFTAHAAVELYAMIFDQAGALDSRFEAFLSINGPLFYGVEPSREIMTLRRESWTVDNLFHYSPQRKDVIWPFGYEKNKKARQPIEFKLATNSGSV